MVYTDGIHLTSDSVDELHQFAKEIGLKRKWFQNHRNPHYDLFGSKVDKALKNGAIPVTDRQMIIIKRTGFYCCNAYLKAPVCKQQCAECVDLIS